MTVCPIHLHFLFFISFSMGSCLVVFQSVVLGTLSVHFRCSILRRHLLMKVTLHPLKYLDTCTVMNQVQDTNYPNLLKSIYTFFHDIQAISKQLLSCRHGVKYIEMYLNTNTFEGFKYKYF